MTKSLVLAAGAVMCLCACAGGQKAAKAAEPDAREYYPLALGTRWTYEVSLLGEKRSIDVAIEREVGDGFVADSTGAQLMADAFGVRDQKRYLLRNPVRTGTRWTNVVSVSSVERYEIVSADEPCDAPAGAWAHCVVVKSRNQVQEGKALVNEMTFAPGVGIVRIATVLESDGQRVPQSTLELTSFQKP